MGNTNTEGWIKLHRKIMDNPYYFSEAFTRSQAWIDLLIIANHKDNFFYKRGIKVEVKRGQIGWDLENLAKRWRWSRGKAERFINELEKSLQIVRQKTNVSTLLSIVNYEQYQQDDKSKSKANNKPEYKADGQQIANQTDTNKNEKNDNNEKKELYPFSDFWKAYPKKTGKKICIPKWEKLSDEIRSKIMVTLPGFIAYKPFETYNHPNPETYFNQERWEDEIPNIEKMVADFKKSEFKPMPEL